MGIVDLKSNLAELRHMKQMDKLEDSVDPDPIINNPLRSNQNFPYVRNIVDSEKTPSPIEILHNNDPSTVTFPTYDPAGLQNRPVTRFPLGEYYSQLNTDTRLGIRKNSKFGPEQPFVVREIGDRWGVFDTFDLGNSNFGNTVEDIVKIGASFVDDIGGSVLGRDPSSYIGSAFGAYERTAKFLITPQGIGFLGKQSILQSRNPQRYRTDVKYGLTKDSLKSIENPRLYNPLSLASLPGVTKIDILAPDPTLAVADYVDTIANIVSRATYIAATTVKKTAVRTLTGVATGIGDALSNAFGKSKLGTDISKFQKDFKEEKTKHQKKIDAFNTVMTSKDAKISKLTGIKIDPKIFGEVEKDRVNLIPYGSDEHKGKSYRDLDFVPFKFYDVNNKKSIVFRAILSAITDTFTPEYASERYIGRPDNVYVYVGTQREISFTFDIYPKSDAELLTLWEKMNYLAGLTYPSWAQAAGGGMGMIAPFCKLTLGQMYDNTSGYISGLTYTVMDEGTWETTFAKLPKYIQASCTFVYIGDRLPSSQQKHYEVPWVGDEKYETEYNETLSEALGFDPNKLADEAAKAILGKVGL